MSGFSIEIDVTAMLRFGILYELAKANGFPGVQMAMRQAGKVIQGIWLKKIQERLPDDRGYYAEVANKDAVVYGIGGDMFSAGVFAVNLKDGGAGRAVVAEHGSPQWDMKPALLKGKTSMNVMFRHATTNKKGSALWDRMSPDIAKQAKKLSVYNTEQRAYKGSEGHDESYAWRERLNRTGFGDKDPAKSTALSGFGKRTKMLTEINQPIFRGMTSDAGPHGSGESTRGRAAYTWASGKYDDMARLPLKNTDKGGTETNYVTWRHLSINSPPNSWWYPAIAATPVIPYVIPEANEAIQALVMDGMMADLGFTSK